MAAFGFGALRRAGKQVRLSVTGDGPLHSRQVRPGEFDQLEAEGGVNRRSALGGDYFERSDDVLGKLDGHGAEGQQGRQDGRSIVSERGVDLCKGPRLQRDVNRLTPRKAPLAADSLPVAVVASDFPPQLAEGYPCESGDFGEPVRLPLVEKQTPDALSLIHRCLPDHSGMECYACLWSGTTGVPDVTTEGTEPGRAAVRRYPAPTSERARPESGTARRGGEPNCGLHRLHRARGECGDADGSPQTGEGAQHRCGGLAERVHATGVEANEVVGRRSWAGYLLPICNSITSLRAPFFNNGFTSIPTLVSASKRCFAAGGAVAGARCGSECSIEPTISSIPLKGLNSRYVKISEDSSSHPASRNALPICTANRAASASFAITSKFTTHFGPSLSAAISADLTGVKSLSATFNCNSSNERSNPSRTVRSASSFLAVSRFSPRVSSILASFSRSVWARSLSFWSSSLRKSRSLACNSARNCKSLACRSPRSWRSLASMSAAWTAASCPDFLNALYCVTTSNAAAVAATNI